MELKKRNVNVPKFKMGFETRYIISEDETTVIAFVKPKSKNPDKHLYGNLDTTNCMYYINPNLPVEFKGVARLKDNDTNNVFAAKEIARKKAIRSYYKSLYVATAEWEDVLWAAVNALSYREQIKARINETNSEIEKLIK